MVDTALAKNCKFNDVFFEELENDIKLMDGDSLQGTVNFSFADPRYNTRHFGKGRARTETSSRSRTCLFQLMAILKLCYLADMVTYSALSSRFWNGSAH